VRYLSFYQVWLVGDWLSSVASCQNIHSFQYMLCDFLWIEIWRQIMLAEKFPCSEAALYIIFFGLLL
jgi:hypothetical protein